MVDYGRLKNSRGAMAAGAAVLLVLGAAGGAGAMRATRPTVEMAPTVQTPIARLAATHGVVTAKGRVAEVYGDRFVIEDATGRAMIAAGHGSRGAVSVGQQMMVQGRFDDGQLRASYLVDRNGSIAAVGPRGPRPGGPDEPGRSGPRGGPRSEGLPPPPLPGCAPRPEGRDNPSLPPGAGALPSTNEAVPPTRPSATPTPPPVAGPSAPARQRRAAEQSS